MILFNNKDILIDGTTIFYQDWVENGVLRCLIQSTLVAIFYHSKGSNIAMELIVIFSLISK